MSAANRNRGARAEVAVVKRFVSKWSESDDGCWQWTGTTDRLGYGVFWLNGKNRRAHRVSYELRHGALPAQLSLDHLCRNRGCVNPDHLEPVTHQENVRRGRSGVPQSQRTHCPHGHRYDEANTKWARTGSGHMSRQCRACARESDRRRRAQKKAER